MLALALDAGCKLSNCWWCCNFWLPFTHCTGLDLSDLSEVDMHSTVQLDVDVFTKTGMLQLSCTRRRLAQTMAEPASCSTRVHKQNQSQLLCARACPEPAPCSIDMDASGGKYNNIGSVSLLLLPCKQHMPVAWNNPPRHDQTKEQQPSQAEIAHRQTAGWLIAQTTSINT